MNVKEKEKEQKVCKLVKKEEFLKVISDT